ncbi:hypothetical protein FGO68_gene10746 [Halteria grandinella]|uniref:PHR domain-containing protein n=1 Tax=Halteria grandinella TaxID=5974 RepID=A0A8J8T4X1_HALGN|nr:hypothetical protein FGO68_gene10746 [Halteria grandinella]
MTQQTRDEFLLVTIMNLTDKIDQLEQSCTQRQSAISIIHDQQPNGIPQARSQPSLDGIPQSTSPPLDTQPVQQQIDPPQAQPSSQETDKKEGKIEEEEASSLKKADNYQEPGSNQRNVGLGLLNSDQILNSDNVQTEKYIESKNYVSKSQYDNLKRILDDYQRIEKKFSDLASFIGLQDSQFSKSFEDLLTYDSKKRSFLQLSNGQKLKYPSTTSEQGSISKPAAMISQQQQKEQPMNAKAMIFELAALIPVNFKERFERLELKLMKRGGEDSDDEPDQDSDETDDLSKLSKNGAQVAKFTQDHFPEKKLFVRFERIEKKNKKKALLDELIGKEGWSVSKDKWDAIIFEPKKDVRIYGVGIYQQVERLKCKYTLCYKYLIEDKQGKKIDGADPILEKERQPEENCVILNFFVHQFQRFQDTGILVKAGQRFHYAQWIMYKEGKPKTFNARGDNRPIKSDDDFKILRSKLDTNGTTVETGLIPSILYTYAS